MPAGRASVPVPPSTTSSSKSPMTGTARADATGLACRACGNGSWPWAARSTCRQRQTRHPRPRTAATHGPLPGRADRRSRAVSISVLIAEDQRMVLGALGTLLGLEPDLDVVGAAVDGDDALRLVGSLRPDVLVTDIEMPGRTGLDLAAEIRRRGIPTRVVILTTFARSGYLRRALDAGVGGYLLKDAPSATLADAIRTRPQRGAGGRPCPRRRCMGRARPAHRAGASGAAPGWRRAGQRRYFGQFAPVRGNRA